MIVDIPNGNTHDDVLQRRSIISSFFHTWKETNPSASIFNKSLHEDILVRFVSITETCTHAARIYESTKAVLNMDMILMNAKKVGIVKPKNNGNQKTFEKMLVMSYFNKELGNIKITIGIRRRTHEKILYCITAGKEQVR